MSEPQQIVVLTRDELKALISEAIEEYRFRSGKDNGNAHADDRFLTTEEAAARLNVTPSWLYRHWGKLPFARKLSRKALRFSEAELLRWQAVRTRLTP